MVAALRKGKTLGEVGELPFLLVCAGASHPAFMFLHKSSVDIQVRLLGNLNMRSLWLVARIAVLGTVWSSLRKGD